MLKPLLTIILLAPVSLQSQITLGTQTKGILPINQGGTNATSAANALSNLGGVGPATSDTLSNKKLTSPGINDIRGYSTGLQLLLLGDTASAVNYVGIYNNTTGQPAKVAALGSDANVDLELRPQGTGKVDLGDIGAVRVTGCASGQYFRTVDALGSLGCDGGTGSGGAPTGSTYITQTPDATLTNEQALSLLGTGLMKVTTGTGVISTATASDLPAHASRHQLGGSDQLSLDGSLIASGTVSDSRLPSSMAGKTFTSAPKIIVTSEADRRLVIQGYSSSAGTCEGAGYFTLYAGSGGYPEFCAGTTRYTVGNAQTSTSGNSGKLAYYQTDTQISSIYPYDTAATASTFAVRDSSGHLTATRFDGRPASDASAATFRRYSAGAFAYITGWLSETGTFLSGIQPDGTFQGNVQGNASTAASLQSNPTDCATGVAYQIDSAGNLTCKAVDLGVSTDVTGLLSISKINATGTPSSSTALFGDGTWKTTGAGNVIGPGSSTNLYFPQWSGTAGTNLGVGIGGTTAAAANSVLTTNSYGATKIYDLGGEVYDVKAYGAAGDGTTNDTTALQAAIDACQNSTHGGTIYFPPGVYGISSQLTMFNGTTTSVNSKMACRWKGTLGAADDANGDSIVNNHPGASVIKWIGSSPGAMTYMVKLQGPAVGGAMDDIALNAASTTNLGGLYINHVTHMSSNNLTIVKHRTGPGMVITVDDTTSLFQYGACDNTFTHLRVIRPSTGGSGLLLDGNSYGDACSNTFYAPMIWHDNATAGTYGVKLKYADNNRFFGGNFYGVYGGGTPTNNGYSILFEQASNTAFPLENAFYSISASHGFHGQTGTGKANVFLGLNNGDCWYNCQMDVGLSAGGTFPDIQANGSDWYWHNDTPDTNSNLYIATYDNTNVTARSGINLERARGTAASPTTILSGDRMGLVAFWGLVSGGYTAPATIEAYASTVSGANVTSYVDIQTANAGVRASTLKVAPAGLYFNSVGPGVSSTFTAGSCNLTFTGGILTSKSGC